MISALLGLASALGLGVADFMARFSARSLGAPLTYGGVLLDGAVATTVWVVATDPPLVWSPFGCGMAVAHGLAVATMCMLHYMGLARGPIAVVAPIVAAHPALVLVVNVAMGVRPSLLQWGAMATVIAGGNLIAHSAVSGEDTVKAQADRTTLLIALGACFSYVALVLTAQSAAPMIGEVQTVWIGRWVGLAFIVLILLVQRVPIRIPSRWVPYVGLQGSLDTLGYFAFLAGSATAAPHITMVVASTFGVVTVILARLILHEPVSWLQWGSIGLIAVGTSVLSMA
jgi:drug/metabolite transporter (DMT)-like permease